MNSEYAPLVRDLFRAVADNDPRADITALQQTIHDAKRETEKKMDMAHAWFEKRGGWGGEEPDPLPPQWNDRTEKLQAWLWDYQMLQCGQFLTTALLLEQE